MHGGRRSSRLLRTSRRPLASLAVALSPVLLGPGVAAGGVEPGRPGPETSLLETIGDPGLAPDIDVDALRRLLAGPDPASGGPRLGGFGRVAVSDDPTVGRAGSGGLELAWRPEPSLAVGLVAGGRLDTVDRNGWSNGVAAAPSSPMTGLASRTTAFDGLAFGGESAAEVSPVVADRLYSATAGRDLRGTFAATRAVFRPTDDTSVGMVATRGGGADGDASLVGVDVSQNLAGHRIDAWVQQSMGASAAGDPESDRAAFGASLGGDVGGLRYGLGWRRIGDGFLSGLGTSGRPGTHAMIGRLDWRLPLEDLPFVRSWEVGVRARYETDLELAPSRLLVDVDAMRLTATSGDVVEVGIRQERVGTAATFVHADLVERFRVAVRSSAGRPFRIGGGVTFGDPQGQVGATWRGDARWSPGGGFDLGGTIAVDEAFADRRTPETLRTTLDGGFGLGRAGRLRTRVGFDAWQGRLSVTQAIGFELDEATSLSVSVEQDWPTQAGPGNDGVVRARIGGAFRF